MAQKPDPYGMPIRVPQLTGAVTVDGNLSEWKAAAHTDGLWDIARLRQSPWFDPKINRLTLHGAEGDELGDLSARYYIAWDANFLYLGAEVTDNVNDVSDPQHEDKRWYYKDAICWFIEAPRLPQAKKFGEADNAFCFVIDEKRPSYGAWWRHGTPTNHYVEEPLRGATYAIRRTANGGSFVLEAKVSLRDTLARSSPAFRTPGIGDVYGLEIVHTDPDGGDYGGHFLIYGRGDDDATWGWMELTGPLMPEPRKGK